jgi:SAM-dependent methyltransferase
MNVTSAYVLGHADLEIERLQFQADIIAGVSRRLIRECGIGPGMRVLDIGCGAGDVSMLLAEAVGDTGSVVAFDRESRAIEMARTKAIAAGHRQIEFVVASDEAFPACGVFDAAIGRDILHHQSDPVAMIRRAATAVRQGGVVAFHEPAGHVSSHTLAIIGLHASLERCLNSVFDAIMPILADDDVVVNRYPQGRGDVDDRLGHLDIRLRWRWVATRMVVHEVTPPLIDLKAQQLPRRRSELGTGIGAVGYNRS